MKLAVEANPQVSPALRTTLTAAWGVPECPKPTAPVAVSRHGLKNRPLVFQRKTQTQRRPAPGKIQLKFLASPADTAPMASQFVSARDEQKPRQELHFLRSVAAILLLTAAAKFASAFGTQSILEKADPVFGCSRTGTYSC